MKHLKQHSVLLFRLGCRFECCCGVGASRTLNVTVTDAQTGAKLNGVSITSCPKPVLPLKVSVMHPACLKLRIYLLMSTQ